MIFPASLKYGKRQLVMKYSRGNGANPCQPGKRRNILNE